MTDDEVEKDLIRRQEESKMVNFKQQMSKAFSIKHSGLSDDNADKISD